MGEGGSVNIINSKKIKSLISKLVNTDYGFVTKNVDTEIALQIELRNTVMKDNSKNIILPIETTSHSLLDRFENGDEYIDRTLSDLEVLTDIDYFRNYLNLKILSNRTLTIMTSLLVIFVSIRIGIKLFL